MSDRDAPPSSAGDRSDPAHSVDHLSKRFGDRVAFDDVSFAVGHGEVLGFLCPNGAGKTTTPGDPGAGVGWRIVSATFDRERLITETG